MTDYIVAIDLGTSHLTGIIGKKKADGTFSIVACETEKPQLCIRRGNIYNLNDTATRVGNLIKKLERHLDGGYIDKVYIGVGGQSLRTIDHVESKDIEDEATVSNEDINALNKRCEEYKPDLLDVLGIAPAVYYLDGNKDTNPVGVQCKHFEAHYKLVVGRESIRRDINTTIGKCADKKEVAGIIISPLALADAMLSEEEKDMGCALVNFGAGVTTVSVYKNGDLLHMSVIPLGGNLITRDITTLQLPDAEAEKLKKERGCVVLQKEDDEAVISIEMDGIEREIPVNSLNTIIEARSKEIIENVYVRISDVIDIKSLGSGIVIAGCAADMNGLPEFMKEKCKVKVRHSAIRGGLVNDSSDNMLGNPLYMVAISLMLKGTEQCASMPSITQESSDSETTDSGGIGTTPQQPPKRTKDDSQGSLWKRFKKASEDIFGEEES